MTTLKDIAVLAGVSVGTVSTVLNNARNTIKVRESTREKVLETAARLKYIPNLNARALKMDRSFVVGVLVGHIAGSIIPELLEGIEHFFVANNYHMLLGTYHDQNEFADKCMMMKQKRIEGMIVISGCEGLNGIYKSIGMDLPLVGIGCTIDPENGAYVRVDGEEIGYMGARYLLELGHRDIAFFNYHEPERTEGWRRAMREYDIVPPQQMVLHAQRGGYESGREMLCQVIGWKRMPSAIITHSDEMAAGVINQAVEAGIRVPEDLSVVGTDGNPVGQMIRPALTTIDQPKYEQGEAAAQLINDLLGGRRPENIFLKPKLLVRGSCAEVKPEQREKS